MVFYDADVHVCETLSRYCSSRWPSFVEATPKSGYLPKGGKPKCSAVVKAINTIKIAATLLTSTFKIFYNYLHSMWMCILCTDPFRITVTASLIGQLLKVRNQNFDHLQRCNG
jgi:hypothetical protein